MDLLCENVLSIIKKKRRKREGKILLSTSVDIKPIL